MPQTTPKAEAQTLLDELLAKAQATRATLRRMGFPRTDDSLFAAVVNIEAAGNHLAGDAARGEE